MKQCGMCEHAGRLRCKNFIMNYHHKNHWYILSEDVRVHKLKYG